jgi:hypothetical protein
MVNVLSLIDDVMDKNMFIENRSEPLEEENLKGFISKHDSQTYYISGGNVQISPGGQNIMYEEEKPNKDTPTIRSSWANGSFYLFSFAVVITGLGVLANTVSLYHR